MTPMPDPREGDVVREPCPNCDGSGEVTTRFSLRKHYCRPEESPFRNKTFQVAVGQVWASMHGGTYDLLEVVEVLKGRYLRKPDVALIPCEFCRVRWLTGRLQGRVTDQRAPYHRLGHGQMILMPDPRKAVV